MGGSIDYCIIDFAIGAVYMRAKPWNPRKLPCRRNTVCQLRELITGNAVPAAS